MKFDRPGYIFLYGVYALSWVLYLLFNNELTWLMVAVGWFPVVVFHLTYSIKNKPFFN